MIGAALAETAGRSADLAQLALGCAVTRPLFAWLGRERPGTIERMRHEPFAARGEAFVREVGALEKAGFVAKMLGSDGGWNAGSSARSAPAPVGGDESEPEILFAGDVLHPGVVDGDTLSEGLRARIAKASWFVANLEGTVGDAPHEIAPFLTWRGIRQLLAYEDDPTNPDWASRLDHEALTHVFGVPQNRVAVSVANNHTLDEGPLGFARTIDRVRDAGIAVVGDARRGDGGTIFDLGSQRIGMFAMTYGSNRSAPAEGPHQLTFDGLPYCLSRARARAIVDSLRTSGATHVVALLHWGHEHEHEPSEAQRETTRALFDAGVTAVIGHHPHILQCSEAVAVGPALPQRWASYSLGDFVGGDRTIWSRFAGLVSLRFSARGVSGQVIPVVQTPFWRRQRTMLLGEAPGLERAVFARWFERKLP